MRAKVSLQLALRFLLSRMQYSFSLPGATMTCFFVTTLVVQQHIHIRYECALLSICINPQQRIAHIAGPWCVLSSSTAPVYAMIFSV